METHFSVLTRQNSRFITQRLVILAHDIGFGVVSGRGARRNRDKEPATTASQT